MTEIIMPRGPVSDGPSNRVDDTGFRESEERFQANMQISAREAQTRAGDLVGSQDLSSIPWPEVEHYGYEHHREVSQLAALIAQAFGLRGDDLFAVKQAAFLHDIGRRRTWQYPDPTCAIHSAHLAEQVLHREGVLPLSADVRALVCRLVAKHNPDGKAPTDLRQLALHDADVLDAARFAPNTHEGQGAVDRAYARLGSPWCRAPRTQGIWQQHRGWAP